MASVLRVMERIVGFFTEASGAVQEIRAMQLGYLTRSILCGTGNGTRQSRGERCIQALPDPKSDLREKHMARFDQASHEAGQGFVLGAVRWSRAEHHLAIQEWHVSEVGYRARLGPPIDPPQRRRTDTCRILARRRCRPPELHIRRHPETHLPRLAA